MGREKPVPSDGDGPGGFGGANGVGVEGVGYLYITGKEDLDGSIRFGLDVDTGIPLIEKRIEALWQPSSLEAGAATFWLGRRVGVAGVGHHLATEAVDGHMHFHAHSQFDSELTIKDTVMTEAYNYEVRRVLQPDSTGSWEGTTFDSVPFPVFASTIQNGAYFLTGLIAATAPVRVRVWIGVDDTGHIAFDQYYPASTFPASTEVHIIPDGFLEFDTGDIYFMRIDSVATFSLRTNISGTFPWMATDVSDVRENSLLQTPEWTDGDSYEHGQYLIYERKIYVCKETGVQTGSFASNASKWHLVEDKHTEYLNDFTPTGIPYSDSTGSLTDDVTNMSYIPGEQVNLGVPLVLEDNLFSKQTDGIYAGRTRLSQHDWISSPDINQWEAKGSIKSWRGVAASSDTRYITAVADSDQIYTSSDYGETFTARESSRAWTAIAMSSDGKYQSAVVYGGQIYISSDYGVTWSAEETTRNWYSIGMNTTGQYQTAGTHNGTIHVSTDYGQTWATVTKDGSVRSIAISSTGQYQVAGSSGQIVYRSTNYGVTWTGCSGTTIWPWRGVAISDDGQYMTAVSVTANGRIYRSTDYGANFTQTNTGSDKDYISVGMSADGKQQTVVEQNGKVHVSDWYGSSWNQNSSVNRDWRGVAISDDATIQIGVVDNDYIYIQRSNFMSMTKSIGTGSWRQVAISADGRYQTAVGSGETIRISSDYGVTWTEVESSRSYFGIAMSSDGKYQTAAVSYSDLYVSSDYGVTWAAVGAGNPSWTNIAMSSDGRFQVAVCGGEGGAEYIYISYDYGQTWNQKASSQAWQHVACSSDGRYITATKFESIWRSSDYGETWSSSGAVLNWQGVAMSADGKYQTVTNADDEKKIYVSSNYGSSFSQRGVVGEYYAVAMSSDGKYQIATMNSYGEGYSLWISDDYGQTWTILYDTRIGDWTDVKMSSDGKHIIVANNNSGVYTYHHKSTIEGDVNIDGALFINSTEVIGPDGEVSKAALADSDNWDTAYDRVSADSTNWDAAYAHISADGSSHGFIDQDVTESASPTFAGISIYKTNTPFVKFTDEGGEIGQLRGTDSDTIAITAPGGSDKVFAVDTGADTVYCYAELIVRDYVTIQDSTGIFFDPPGGDNDIIIANIVVNGDPEFSWDESEDSFAMTHRLTLFGKKVRTEDELYNFATGWLEGGTVSIAGDNTKLDITAGSILIADYDDQMDPVLTKITWSDTTGVDPALSGRSLWVGVKNDGGGGAEFVFDISFDAIERRTEAIIARIWDNAGTGPQITSVGDYERPAWGLLTAFQDFVLEYGSWNISGNKYSANGSNLTLDKSAGKSFRYNAENVTGQQNVHTDAAQTPRTSYAYHLQGLSIVEGRATIEPDYYDDAGVKTAVPSNKWTIQELWFFPVSGTCHVLYGQAYYNSKGDALTAVSTEDKVRNTEILSGSIKRAYLLVQQGCTELDDDDDAELREVNGMVGGAGAYWERDNEHIQPAEGGDSLWIGAGAEIRIDDLTEGSVLFAGANGAISQDNTNLFWDNTNKRLGIRKTPSYLLDVKCDDVTGVVSNFVRGSNNLIQYFMNATYTDIRFGGAKEENRIGTFIDKPFSLVTNSTERIRIDSAGLVGIGTGDPQGSLHIFKDTESLLQLSRNSDIEDSSVAAGILFGVRTDVTIQQKAAILFRRTTTYGRGDLVFALDNVNDNYNATLSDAVMVIDRAGNVGIGVDDPAYKLDVNGQINATEFFNAAGDLKIQPDVQGNVYLFDGTQVGNGTSGKILYIYRKAPEGNEYMRFYIAANQTGFIHTSCPMTLQAQVDFTIYSVTQNIYFKVGDSAGAKRVYFQDSNNETQMRVDSDGKVFIRDDLWFDNIQCDKISLYDDRKDDTDMYGFGVEFQTLYHKAVGAHRWYLSANADEGVSSIMELTTTGLGIGVGVTPDVRLAVDGVIKKTAAIYNHKKTFQFDPGSVANIYTQYLGTFTADEGTIEIEIQDSPGAWHGSSTYSRIGRGYNGTVTTVAFQQQTGGKGYKFHSRHLDSETYELFFEDLETIGGTTDYEVFIICQGAATDTTCAQNDTDIIECVAGIVVTNDGDIVIGGYSTIGGSLYIPSGAGDIYFDVDLFMGISGGNYALHVDIANKRVGIGTTSTPSCELEVIGDVKISGDLTFSSSTGAKLNLYGTNYAIGVESSELRIASNSAITFYTGGYSGTELVRITSAGRVGIGTDDPKEELHIKSDNPTMTFEEQDAGSNAKVWEFGASSEEFFLRTANDSHTGTQTVFKVTRSGTSPGLFAIPNATLSIGTDSPGVSSALEINSNTGALLISKMSTTQRDNLTAVNGMIIYNTSTSAFNFREGGAWVTK